ncbi:MAG: GNAT family N-acetyltransferase [Amnibacterium sp.]
MPDVRIRPYHEEDAAAFDALTQEPGAFEFFGYRPTNAFRSRYARDGMISEDHGNLAVVVDGVGLVGDVGWFAVHHGPGGIARALNIGIFLVPDHRGHGYGTTAQRLIAEYLFAYTLIERLEASTDVENLAEQRALEKASYTREGVLRHSQFRDGAWRDNVLFSRLRGDA